MAKYSDVAVDANTFTCSIECYTKEQAKMERVGNRIETGSEGLLIGSHSGGPLKRYVEDPANPDRIIDMRHFLSIGDMGEIFGLGVEVFQSTNDRGRPSAFDLQDFYSNNLGKKFYNSNYYKEYETGDAEFHEALRNFFENRVNE